MLEFLKLSLPKLNYQHKLFFIGSCFSDNMAEKLRQDKIEVINNPFGVMFHPDALVKVLERAMNESMYEERDFFEWDGYWFCFEHHSKLAERNLRVYLNKANALLMETKKQLQHTDTLFITLGSAWGYEKEGEVVANCHQQNGVLFDENLLEVNESAKRMRALLKKIRVQNSDLNIVFTVSPVRHYKDGMLENQQSKSLLNTLCHALCDESSNSYYFPSYEYVIDYLRDYKYFKSDKVHPNELAISKLYEFFVIHFFDEYSREVISKWQSLNLSLQHKSLRRYSPSNLKFKESLKKQLEMFESQYHVSCGNEIENISSEIEQIRQGI
ncbi:MAG: hypothetical protein ACJA0Q_000991 [Saprospiraceae bacterium]|jgi:hypothetical protein